MASKYSRILEEEVDAARFTKSWSDLQVIEKKLKNKATLSSHMKALSNVEQEIDKSLCEGSVPNQKLVDKLRDVYISTPKYREIQQQTALILATCEWRLGHVDRAMVLLKESCTPPVFTEGSPPHLLQYCKLQAQGHAVLGLCCEHIGDKESAIKSYQNTMKWLTHLSSQIEQQTRGLSAVNGADIFLPEINMAITQGCILLLMLKGDKEAIGFSRTGVKLHDCPLFLVLREISSLCLANILVFHSSGNQYAPPPAEPRPPTFQKIPVPLSIDEEAILVLSLLLNHPLPPDVKLKEIKHQYQSYLAPSDILVMEYASCSLKKAAVCFTESNLPFTAVDETPWADYFLASVSLGKNPAKLFMVTKEVVKEVKESPCILLFAVKTALAIAHQPLQAMQWALDCISSPSDPSFLPAAHSAVATAALNLHRQFFTSEGNYLRQATDHIIRAQDLDPRNVDLIFRRALILGENRKLRESRSLARAALQLDPTHPGVTHLLAIMLTGEKKLKESLNLIEFALTHWHRDFGLRMSKITLVQTLEGSQTALEVCREVLHTQSSVDGELPRIVVGSSSSSSQAGSSDVLSSTPSSATVTSHSALLWCKTAEIFLSCEKFSDAEESIKEAQQIAPNTTDVLLLTGLLNEAQGLPEEAIAQYKLAIAMNPRHPQPQVAMGKILLSRGKILESKRHLKQAMEVEPKNHILWCLLGQIYTALNKHSKASECFSTALTLEQSAPCLPMSNIADVM
jgi:tetratricopeptide (TPR) repeat protein